MKKNVCIIGPIPPPINGNSKALDTLIRSKAFDDTFNKFIVDLSSSKIGVSGKISFEKIKTVLSAKRKIKNISSNNNIDMFYLTIAQSTVGCIRDIVIIREIFKVNEGAKLVIHLHGGGFKSFLSKAPKILRFLIEKYYSKSNVAIVLSDGLKIMFKNIIEEPNIRIVNNCVDDEFVFIKEDLINKTSLLKSYNPIKILYLSNMIKTKGYFDLLQAVKILTVSNIPVYVTFAGKFSKEDEKNEFFKFVTENNLENNVEYVGIVQGESKKTILLENSIFVLPTYYPQEGQPISILEAMAAGMPIITTRHGGIPDVIDDGENGYFVKPQNPDDISEKIKYLYNNKGLIAEIGLNNYDLVNKKYREVNYVNQMKDIFLNCINS